MEVAATGPLPAPEGDETTAPHADGSGRISAVAVGVAACVAPILYLAYIRHFGVNVPQIDDWSRVPLVHDALHGRLTLGALWAQYNESRIFVGNLVFVVFGGLDHFNLRAIMFFDAALFIVTFWLFLVLFRSYTGRRLCPLAVIVLSVVWFSLADVQNALWGFQTSWYLVVFFFVAMIYLLALPHDRSNTVFVFGGVAAGAASW